MFIKTVSTKKDGPPITNVIEASSYVVQAHSDPNRIRLSIFGPKVDGGEWHLEPLLTEMAVYVMNDDGKVIHRLAAAERPPQEGFLRNMMSESTLIDDLFNRHAAEELIIEWVTDALTQLPQVLRRGDNSQKDAHLPEIPVNAPMPDVKPPKDGEKVCECEDTFLSVYPFCSSCGGRINEVENV